MMKITRVAITALAVLAAAAAAGQTQYDIIKADRNLASAHEGFYDMTVHPQTNAPKGYTPFYISHYGRHGARYAWNEETYTVIRDVLQRAEKAGQLSERGQKLFDDYIPFCKTPVENVGCMVPLGQKQQAFIARTMVQQFPQVFRGEDKVIARASRIQRAITSMGSFSTQLATVDPDLDIHLSSYVSDLCVTRSQASADSRFTEGGLWRKSTSLCSSMEYASRKLDPDSITAKFFTSSPFTGNEEAVKFCIALYDVWSGYRNYSADLFLEDAFTPDELCSLWEAANYRDCKTTIESSKCDPQNLVDDLISRADEAIAGSGVRADLRFGHDVVISIELMYLNVNGFGRIPKDEDEVRDCFQTYNVPMASNLQFVFYRSRRSPEILFKLLLNGSEATLEDLTPVTGPYYKWNDFRDRYGK